MGTLNLFQYVIAKATDKNPKRNLAITYECNMVNLIDKIHICVVGGQTSYSKTITPLHITAMDGNVEQCRIIMDNSDDCNPTSETDDVIPLEMAARNGHFEVFKSLFQRTKVHHG